MKNKSNFRKNILWILILVGLLLAVRLGTIIWNHPQDADYEPRVCGGDQCFMVELARTPAEQELGLMNRTGMDERDGMLFIFPKSDIYNFWMKNTLIPLDMVRIDDQMNVVKILTAQPCAADPCSIYRPEVAATYVLEINAGMAQKHGIQEGMNMKLINTQ